MKTPLSLSVGGFRPDDGLLAAETDKSPTSVSEFEDDDFLALTLTDIQGKLISLDAQDTRGVLMVFASQTCPIANVYAPRIQKIYDEYSIHGILCLLIHVDPNVSDQRLREHAQEYALAVPVIHDRTHALVTRASATVTPQAVLFNPQGKIVYTGRIDDQYVDFGVKRRRPSSHDLVNALDAFLAGSTVAPSTTEAVGCYIEDLMERH